MSWLNNMHVLFFVPVFSFCLFLHRSLLHSLTSLVEESTPLDVIHRIPWSCHEVPETGPMASQEKKKLYGFPTGRW